MKKFLLSVLSSPRGKLLTWTGSLITGGIALAAGRFGFDLDPDTQGWLTTVVTTGIAAAVETWVGYENAKGIQKIQRATGQTVDAFAGPQTVAAVKEAAKK